MTAPLFRMTNGVALPRIDVSASIPRDDDVLAWMNRTRRDNPGLYVFAAAHCWRERPLRRDLSWFVHTGIKYQLRYLGLPARPAIGRILAKLRFSEIADEDVVNQLRRWLNAKRELPKVLLHAQHVHLSYLEALMRNEWLACLPYPTDMGLHPESDEGIKQFLTLFDLFCHVAGELEIGEATLVSGLGRIRSYDDFRALYERLEEKHRRQRMIDDNVQVPLPLEEIEGIEAPRTLLDFESLSDLQSNCVQGYFHRARAGHCAIYTVVSNGQVMLTAELVPTNDDFWYPSEVLARENTLPREQDVEHLFHWLALAQAEPNDGDGYTRNLMRLMEWTCHWTLHEEGPDGLDPFAQIQVNATAKLIAQRAANGHAGQMGLAFDQPTSAIRKEKE